MSKRIFPLIPLVSLTVGLASLFVTTICPNLLFGAESTNERKQQRWAAFPVIASSPETGLMLGGMLFHFFPTAKAEQQASTVDIMAYGTTEGQYALAVSPNIFLKEGSYRLDASLYGNYWRGNYYEIGINSPEDHEEYDSSNYGAILTVEARYFDAFILDLMGHYENTDMDIEAGGMLDSGNIRGADDGEYIGVGLGLGYDTRDNTNAPSRGLLTRYEYRTYDQDIGSSLDFTIQTLDLRYYAQTAFVKDSVVALAAQITGTSGEVPFRYLATPDGTNILRGIENGRYKDNKMVALQTEYRFPIKAKFSGTVFVEFAQVANTFGDLELDETKTSIGCGIRYALNHEQRFNLRGDVAWVDDGIGMIINIREAF